MMNEMYVKFWFRVVCLVYRFLFIYNFLFSYLILILRIWEMFDLCFLCVIFLSMGVFGLVWEFIDII